jgi:hypothetical protein
MARKVTVCVDFDEGGYKPYPRICENGRKGWHNECVMVTPALWAKYEAALALVDKLEHKMVNLPRISPAYEDDD